MKISNAQQRDDQIARIQELSRSLQALGYDPSQSTRIGKTDDVRFATSEETKNPVKHNFAMKQTQKGGVRLELPHNDDDDDNDNELFKKNKLPEPTGLWNGMDVAKELLPLNDILVSLNLTASKIDQLIDAGPESEDALNLAKELMKKDMDKAEARKIVNNGLLLQKFKES